MSERVARPTQEDRKSRLSAPFWYSGPAAPGKGTLMQTVLQCSQKAREGKGSRVLLDSVTVTRNCETPPWWRGGRGGQGCRNPLGSPAWGQENPAYLIHLLWGA